MNSLNNIYYITYNVYNMYKYNMIIINIYYLNHQKNFKKCGRVKRYCLWESSLREGQRSTGRYFVLNAFVLLTF